MSTVTVAPGAELGARRAGTRGRPAARSRGPPPSRGRARALRGAHRLLAAPSRAAPAPVAHLQHVARAGLDDRHRHGGAVLGEDPGHAELAANESVGHGYSTLISTSTPAGRSSLVSASIVWGRESWMSSRRLCVRSSNCSRLFLSTCGLTQHRPPLGLDRQRDRARHLRPGLFRRAHDVRRGLVQHHVVERLEADPDLACHRYSSRRAMYEPSAVGSRTMSAPP